MTVDSYIGWNFKGTLTPSEEELRTGERAGDVRVVLVRPADPANYPSGAPIHLLGQKKEVSESFFLRDLETLRQAAEKSVQEYEAAKRIADSYEQSKGVSR